MSNKHMNCLTIGIIALFIVSAVSPLAIGYESDAVIDIETKTHDCLNEDIHIYIRGGFKYYHLIVANYGNDTVNAYFNVTLKSIFTNEISIDSGEFDAGPQLTTEFSANSPYFFSYIQANLSVCGKTLTRSGFVIMKFIIFTSTEFTKWYKISTPEQS